MTRRRARRHAGRADGLLRDLMGPDLPAEAACTGAAPMFDLALADEPDDARTARHATAVRVCRRCPVLGACELALDAERHPAGVWAGRVIDSSGRGARTATAARS